ncbi:SDR family oxidoreductase [Fusibacter paucivorans]|uniref:SDR family oxidoreductase n=1 Tax=Fusibacter paucivorans TaxID=76009 RepID=A0ABS5PLP6_9FIRM|nr:SDR family oxidoreductase [Fusibacter paucivorans]
MRVNGVVPGYVQTEKHYRDDDFKSREKQRQLPLKAYATPYEIGGAVAFLCSERSKQINGAIIDCTGGTLV